MPPIKKSRGNYKAKVKRKASEKSAKRIKTNNPESEDDDTPVVKLKNENTRISLQESSSKMLQEGFVPSKLLKEEVANIALAIYQPKQKICVKCNKKFKFKKSLTEHLRDEHSEAPGSLPCKDCSACCPTMEALLKHVSKAHARKEFSCPTCNQSFTRMSHVLRHQRIICNNNDNQSYLCEICEKTYTRIDNLMVHLRTHIKVHKYRCKHCSFTAPTFQKYANHVQREHSPNIYECDICGRKTSSRQSIRKHLEIHGEKKYECEVCGYRTYTIEVIRRHVLCHLKDKPHKCNKCPRSFIQKAQLKQHILYHQGNECSICSKIFKTPAQLQIHLREHNSLAPLLCTYENCKYSNKPFSNKLRYMEHLKVHEDKAHKCELCNKRFGSEINMKIHLRTHTLDRPRRCMYCMCARAYIRGEMLVRHIRSRHPAIFQEHLSHVRQVLGHSDGGRLMKSETESIINLLDAITDRIMEQNDAGETVLYGGMEDAIETTEEPKGTEQAPLLSEEELSENIKKLLNQFIDLQTLEHFGWPDADVDVLLEKVISQCDAKPADRTRWSRVQCLRENAKHLFLHVLEDKTIARMLNTHTIDQVVLHILKISDDANEDEV